jgi:anti-sigma-K factor RskA
MTEWTIDTLKAHFDDLLTERINTIRQTEKSFAEAIDKIEAQINDASQKYASKTSHDNLRKEIEAIKIDHVQRREFNEIKDQQNQGRGARLAAAGALGIIITLITVALGLMYSNQITHEDISNQISRESPWAEDKPQIEEEIHQLQQEIALLKTQLTTHEVTDKIRYSQRKK